MKRPSTPSLNESVLLRAVLNGLLKRVNATNSAITKNVVVNPLDVSKIIKFVDFNYNALEALYLNTFLDKNNSASEKNKVVEFEEDSLQLKTVEVLKKGGASYGIVLNLLFNDAALLKIYKNNFGDIFDSRYVSFKGNQLVVKLSPLPMSKKEGDNNKESTKLTELFDDGENSPLPPPLKKQPTTNTPPPPSPSPPAPPPQSLEKFYHENYNDIIVGHFLNRLVFDLSSQNPTIPQSINFMLTLDWMKAHTTTNNGDANVLLTMTEPGFDFHISKFTPENFYFFLFNLLHALHVAQVQYGFVHNDLHSGNVLLKPLNKELWATKRTRTSTGAQEEYFFVYDIPHQDGKRVEREVKIAVPEKTPGEEHLFVPFIIDYGRCRVQVPYRNAHLKGQYKLVRGVFEQEQSSFSSSSSPSPTTHITRILMPTMTPYFGKIDSIFDHTHLTDLISRVKNPTVKESLSREVNERLVSVYTFERGVLNPEKSSTTKNNKVLVAESNYSIDMRLFATSFLLNHMRSMTVVKENPTTEFNFMNIKLNLIKDLLFDVVCNLLPIDHNDPFSKFLLEKQMEEGNAYCFLNEDVDDFKTRLTLTLKNLIKNDTRFNDLLSKVNILLDDFTTGVWRVKREEEGEEEEQEEPVTTTLNHLIHLFNGYKTNDLLRIKSITTALTKKHLQGIHCFVFTILFASILYGEDRVKKQGKVMHTIFSMTCLDEVITNEPEEKNDISFFKSKLFLKKYFDILPGITFREAYLKSVVDSQKFKYKKYFFGNEENFLLKVTSEAIKFDNKEGEGTLYRSSLIAYLLIFSTNLWNILIKTKMDMFFPVGLVEREEDSNTAPPPTEKEKFEHFLKEVTGYTNREKQVDDLIFTRGNTSPPLSVLFYNVHSQKKESDYNIVEQEQDIIKRLVLIYNKPPSSKENNNQSGESTVTAESEREEGIKIAGGKTITLNSKKKGGPIGISSTHVNLLLALSGQYNGFNCVLESIAKVNMSHLFEEYLKVTSGAGRAGTIKLERDGASLVDDYYEGVDWKRLHDVDILPHFFKKRPVDIILKMFTDTAQTKGEYIYLSKFRDFSEVNKETSVPYIPISCSICKNTRTVFQDTRVNKVFCSVKCQKEHYINFF